MITRLILIAALLMMPLSLFGAELSVFYIGGWAPSYSLDLDFDQGVLLYKGPVKTGERATTSVQKPIKDSKKIGLYCRELLSSIPEKIEVDTSEDASYYWIEYHDGDTKISRTLPHISPNPPIRFFEDLTIEEQQKHLQNFKKLVDAFVLITFLEDLLEHYTGVKPSNIPPIPYK